jgi:hypothetical protein
MTRRGIRDECFPWKEPALRRVFLGLVAAVLWALPAPTGIAVQPGECKIVGGGTGAGGDHCGGPGSLWQELSFHVTASCKDLCTGDTSPLDGMAVTATGVCPTCGTDYWDFNKNDPSYAAGPKFSSSAYDTLQSTFVPQCYNDAALHESYVVCSCPPCSHDTPIVISTTDEHYQLTSQSDGVLFDMDGDGTADQTAWTAAGADDGFLALDRNENGTIDGASELFGNRSPQFPSDDPNGWRALAVWDDLLNGGNEDGRIDAEDFIFGELKLWIDADHDGVSQSSELLGLAESGITWLDLDYRLASRQDQFGNLFKYRGRVGRGNGGVRIAWDVVFTLE